jgi:hypothetical protein
MRRIRLIILGIAILISMITVVVISAGSLWGGSNRAQLLSISLGSFAAGATLANLIRDVRKK